MRIHYYSGLLSSLCLFRWISRKPISRPLLFLQIFFFDGTQSTHCWRLWFYPWLNFNSKRHGTLSLTLVRTRLIQITIQIHHGRREVWNRKSLFGIIDSLNDPYIKKVSSLNVLLTFQKSQVRGNWGKKIYIRHDPPIF